MSELYLSISEAAKVIGISRQGVFDLLRRGKLGEAKHFRSPNPKQRFVMVRAEAVEKWKQLRYIKNQNKKLANNKKNQ